MNVRRSFFAAALLTTILFAALASTAGAAPVATRIDGLYGTRINNQQQVLGFTDTGYGEGYQPMALWTKGAQSNLVGPVASFNMSVESDLNELGQVLGDAYDFAGTPPAQPTKLGLFQATTKESQSLSYPGHAFWLLTSGEVMSYDGTQKGIFRNGSLAFTVPEGVIEVVFAADGSFVLNYGSSTAPDAWYASTSATPVSLPDSPGTTGYAIGSNGHVASLTYGSALAVHRWTVDAKSGVAAHVSYPVTGVTFRGLEISGKGTIVYGVASSNVYETATVGVFRIPHGGTVEDLTPIVGAVTMAVVSDINEWGDIVVAGRTGTLQTGFKGWSILLAGARSALTGVVQPTTVASGRARAGRAGLAGKTVKLTGGVQELTATTDAKGKFTINVPAGAGYTLVAPTGTCLVTGNGCHTSTPLAPVAENGKPIALAKVVVPALAAFTQKPNAVVTVANGKVSLSVRCRATVACRVTVTLRKGTKVYGVGTATVAKNATKSVMVTLNPAAKTALMSTATIPVGATLVTKAGPTKATSALSIKVRRGR